MTKNYLFLILFLLSACSSQALTREEALQKWRDPFIYSAFAYAVCQKAEAAPEEIDRVAYAESLKLLVSFVDEWPPLPDQAGTKEPLKSAILGLSEVIEESKQATESCLALEKVALDIQDRARADGLTDGDLVVLIEKTEKEVGIK